MKKSCLSLLMSFTLFTSCIQTKSGIQIINHANHLGDIAKFYQAEDAIPWELDLPKILFDNIKKKHKVEQSWQALYKYESLMDGGTSLLFSGICLQKLMDDPLCYFNRYIKGDDLVLVFLIRALSADRGAHGNIHSSVRASGYKSWKDFLSKLNEQLILKFYESKEKLIRHRIFFDIFDKFTKN